MSDTFDAYYKWLGIPPREQPPNHYRLLGINAFEADREVIEAASYRQIKHLRDYALGKHVDLSQKLLNEVASAKVCLMDPARKAAYDEQLRNSLAIGPAPTSALPPAGRTATVANPPSPGPAPLGPSSNSTPSSPVAEWPTALDRRRIWLAAAGTAAALLIAVVVWALLAPPQEAASADASASPSLDRTPGDAPGPAPTSRPAVPAAAVAPASIDPSKATPDHTPQPGVEPSVNVPNAKPKIGAAPTTIDAAPAPKDIDSICRGVARVYAGPNPGAVEGLSDAWCPIVTGDEDTRAPHVCVIVREYGAGRVAVFGGEELFVQFEECDNLQVIQNLVTWLAGGRGQSLCYTTGHGEWWRGNGSFAARMAGRGWAIRPLPGRVVPQALKGVSVLLIGNAWGDFTPGEVDAIRIFVQDGGGLCLLGLGWSWAQYHPTVPFDAYPMMQMAEPYEVRWLTNVISDPTHRYKDGPLFHSFGPATRKFANPAKSRQHDPAETTQGENKATARTRWLNESYNQTIYHVRGNQWAQVDNKDKRVSGRFIETERTDEFVELNGFSFGVGRLYSDRLLMKKQQGTWEWASNGHWEPGP